MWLSRKIAGAPRQSRAETGVVTIDGDQMEVAATGSSRAVAVYGPYGYYCTVPSGEDVLLVPAQAGQVAAGVKTVSDWLPPGEIMLQSAGGASIILKNDGHVVINGSHVF